MLLFKQVKRGCGKSEDIDNKKDWGEKVIFKYTNRHGLNTLAIIMIIKKRRKLIPLKIT